MHVNNQLTVYTHPSGEVSYEMRGDNDLIVYFDSEEKETATTAMAAAGTIAAMWVSVLCVHRNLGRPVRFTRSQRL